MRNIIVILILTSLLGSVCQADCFGRPQPCIIWGNSGSDPSFDRWACDPNPRGLRIDMTKITQNFGMAGRLTSPSLSTVKFETWKVDTTTIFLPNTQNPKKYTQTEVGFVNIEFQNKTGGAIYSGSLAGAVNRRTGEGPLITFGAGESNSLIHRSRPIIYQTGDSRLLGKSKVLTVSSDGCFYCSLGMVVASYFGTGSIEYTHWSSMKWMVDNGCFSDALLLPAIAASKLSMWYTTESADQAGMEKVYQKGWRAIISLKGHFMYCVPQVGIATDGRVLWDVIIDPNRTRESHFERDKNGNLKVWSGTNIPRLTVNPAYSGRLKNLRVFAPNNRNVFTVPGGSVPYPMTRMGWWNEKPKTTTAALSLPATEDPRLTGLRGISAVTRTGLQFEKVITPIGDLVAEGSIDGLSLFREEPNDDRWPEPYLEEEYYSELLGDNSAPQGVYTFCLKGTPKAPYTFSLAWFDSYGQLTGLNPSGVLDNNGRARVDLNFMPGTIEPVVWQVENLTDIKSQQIGDQVSLEALLEATDANGFYCRWPSDPVGMRIDWESAITASPGDLINITGTLVSKDPEVVIQATENPTDLGFYAEIRPVMQASGWTYGIRPLCRLVKLPGRLENNDGPIRFTNGREVITVENLPNPLTLPLDQTIVLIGVLRADGSFQYVGQTTPN